MNDKLQIEELAKLDNLLVNQGVCYDTVVVDGDHEHTACFMIDFPDYLNSHDAIQSIVDNMKNDTADRYLYMLEAISCRSRGRLMGGLTSNAFLAKATARQKAEAILKIYKKWEEE